MNIASYQEKETPARMANELKSVGFDVTPNFGGNNVVGLFNGKKTVLRVAG